MPVFGAFDFDPAARRLARNGEEIHLRPKAFSLLELLLEAAPRIVPKREIHDRLWPRGIVTDATLVALVKELRRALDDRDADAPIIRTVHRVGYALNTQVRRRPARCGTHWLVATARERFALTHGDNVIGRNPLANVWLEDLGSKNGTSVAGNRVIERVTLRNGDLIAFGRVLVTYRQSGAGLATVTEVSRLTAARPGT
jgi:DNA-binding winged helix-turn-helix (wHTH) protein